LFDPAQLERLVETVERRGKQALVEQHLALVLKRKVEQGFESGIAAASSDDGVEKRLGLNQLASELRQLCKADFGHRSIYEALRSGLTRKREIDELFCTLAVAKKRKQEPGVTRPTCAFDGIGELLRLILELVRAVFHCNRIDRFRTQRNWIDRVLGPWQ